MASPARAAGSTIPSHGRELAAHGHVRLYAPFTPEVAAATDARTQAGPQRHVIIAGHSFVQNVWRGYYELAVEVPIRQRLTVAIDDLALAI
jgi:hypothetical protein